MEVNLDEPTALSTQQVATFFPTVFEIPFNKFHAFFFNSTMIYKQDFEHLHILSSL